jgi:hypothetical protein
VTVQAELLELSVASSGNTQCWLYGFLSIGMPVVLTALRRLSIVFQTMKGGLIWYTDGSKTNGGTGDCIVLYFICSRNP